MPVDSAVKRLLGVARLPSGLHRLYFAVFVQIISDLDELEPPDADEAPTRADLLNGAFDTLILFLGLEPSYAIRILTEENLL